MKVAPLTWVEGQGNISIEIERGKVKQAHWDIVEPPRFFEAMLKGKKWDNAPYITSRICGICSISHSLAGIQAIEKAFNIKPHVQTDKLRLVLLYMEILQSHIFHLYFLSAPDFLHTGSMLPLIKTHPDMLQRAARIKLLANDACDLIAGRRFHPVRTVVGGFTMLPEKSGLHCLVRRLKEIVDDLMATAELFKTFTMPDFIRETEFVSLHGKDHYPFIGSDLISTDGVRMKEGDYQKMTNEYVVPHSTSKWSRLSRESFAVGALARINNNFDLLNSRARQTAKTFNLAPVNHNPYMNNAAQLVECIHLVMESIAVIEDLLDTKWHEHRQTVTPSASSGVGVIEAPRGILYHAYEFDEKGIILKADYIMPTTQNNANIHYDIAELARQCAAEGKIDTQIQHMAEMLVRSYDPCISCSVH